jgi:DNA-binding Xre family transcriptional regulator
MFDVNEVIKIMKATKNNEYTIKLKNKKAFSMDALGISLNAFNNLLRINNEGYSYDISLLAKYFKDNKIGYTKIIRELGIPKATLSQMLNSGRNIKLSTLNRIFDHYKISKDILRREK